MTEYLREKTGTFETVWHCPPPPATALYLVIEEYWTGSYSSVGSSTDMVRHINEIKVMPAKGSGYAGTADGMDLFVTDEGGQYKIVRRPVED